MKFVLKLICEATLTFSVLYYVYFESVIVHSGKEDKVTISSENIETLQEIDWQSFFKEREKVYEERRRRINAYCKLQESNFSRSYNHLLWYPKAGISLCPINKIGSTTYFNHFGHLENVNKTRFRVQILEHFQPPNGM